MSRPVNFYKRFGKRAVDLAVALPATVLLSPAAGVVALTVRRKLGSPVLFRQQRPGLGGRSFELVKFRTMTDARDEAGALLPDALRLTPFGRFLRASSLDELPTLYNVLKGDMSLVGPRPLLTQYLARYSPAQARRHEVRPGITGWAQVRGRNALRWDDKLRLDVWYVDHCSAALDARILFETVRAVVLREGISADGHATMPEFMGSEAAAAEGPRR
ncbi:MAG: sugar transferase [Myxococcales bacterium]|nr:sugar transferase [Myxococcales bacterium]